MRSCVGYFNICSAHLWLRRSQRCNTSASGLVFVHICHLYMYNLKTLLSHFMPRNASLIISFEIDIEIRNIIQKQVQKIYHFYLKICYNYFDRIFNLYTSVVTIYTSFSFAITIDCTSSEIIYTHTRNSVVDLIRNPALNLNRLSTYTGKPILVI